MGSYSPTPTPDAPPASAAPLDVMPGPALDAHLFRRIVTFAAGETDRPLTAALGLNRAALECLLSRHLPEMRALLRTLPPDSEPDEDAIEEADLRALLLEHRAGHAEEPEWLAAIVARRSLGTNHLWQDMGFANRLELNAMFRRHFPALVALNGGDMKWKKFFYRQLCSREGFLLCKSPNCESCDDYAACFDGEPGEALRR
ncbi:nitrogen fixation protein NifQ [Azospirillum sp.]|uniref:nitrogen fixation protein NifQ n=1 Tax=Azospirillum sp. TaxID=34012 RepID=UPI002D2852E5|nr:nitrogen fixation protein NifQ [Azospirillum sp.]HYD70605.1 nitrogen fixation protein NifQ [Azospirillum sp.]